jgi:hypothetical protein
VAIAADHKNVKWYNIPFENYGIKEAKWFETALKNT